VESPKETHWKEGKNILRYIAGTIQYVIFYTNSKDNHIVGYTNSDFVRSIDDKKSTSSYEFQVGISLISLTPNKQPIIAISLAKVEYVATIGAKF